MRLKRLLAALTVATMTATGQQPETPFLRQLSVDVDVVLVNATVTDSQGRYLAKLDKEGFRLWEDRIEQKIEYFASEDIPQTVGILFDVSGSMHNKITIAREAAMKFLQTGKRDDEFFLIEFNDRAELSKDFHSELCEIGKPARHGIPRREHSTIRRYLSRTSDMSSAIFPRIQIKMGSGARSA